MEIIRAATEWAKAEIVSSVFFMLFGLLYIVGSIGLWKFGNTPMTKALFIPLLVAGGLLLGAGVSFYLSSRAILTNLEIEYNANPAEWINSEIQRVESTKKTYENVAMKVFPAIIVVAVFVFFLVSNSTLRSISLAIIAFLVVLVLLDSQALKRIMVYHDKLKLTLVE